MKDGACRAGHAVSESGLRKFPRASISSAFSLLELLVVIALIVILTTLYWNSNSGGRQKKSYADCEINLQKVYVALELFSNDHNEKFPFKPGARSSA